MLGGLLEAISDKELLLLGVPAFDQTYDIVLSSPVEWGILF